MDLSKLKTFALSISGGGAKGAYAVGVIKYLWENGIREFRSIFGTSTGALVSTKVALACISGDQKHIDDLEYIFRTIQKPDIASPTRKFFYKLMGQSGLFALQMLSKRKESIYDNSPLRKLVDKYITDDDWRLLIDSSSASSKHPLELGYQVTDMQAAKSFAITNETHPDIEALKKALIASTSIPVLFPLTEFEDKQIADGGIMNVMPIESLFASKHYNEYDAIISVALDPPYTTTREEEFYGSSKTLLRVFDIFLANTMHFDYMVGHLINAFNLIKGELSIGALQKLKDLLPPPVQAHLQLEEDNKPLPIYEIFPQTFLGYGLEFKQPIMGNWIDMGYEDARRKFNFANEDFSNEVENIPDPKQSEEIIEEVIGEIFKDAIAEEK